MTNKIPFTWERINNFYQKKVGGSNTHRAKVYGGWLVSLESYTDVLHQGNERSLTVSLCFVADPEHKWEIDNDN